MPNTAPIRLTSPDRGSNSNEPPRGVDRHDSRSAGRPDRPCRPTPLEPGANPGYGEQIQDPSPDPCKLSELG